jgi:hypothetical protein
MTLQIKRHLGEEIVIKGLGFIKPIKLKITNVFEQDVTIEVDHDPTVAVADELYFDEPKVCYEKLLDIREERSKKKIRTPIEQVIYLKAGRELEEIMREMASLKKSLLDVSNTLGVHTESLRRYCKKYKISFKKLPPGWSSKSEYRKNVLDKKY